MPNTREQILEHLRLHPDATAREIAAALQVTPANIRYHLRLLQEAGLVEPTLPEVPGGRGRPAYRYHLTSAAQRAHLEPLVRALLAVMRQEGGLEGRFSPLAAALLGEEDLPFKGNLRQRIQRLVQLLNQLGYEASWEAHHRGPLLLLRRCPFATLREAYPELCRLDHFLLEQALGRPVEQIQAAPQASPGSPAVCRYQVSLRE